MSCQELETKIISNVSYNNESRRVRQLLEGLIFYLTHCAQQRCAIQVI